MLKLYWFGYLKRMFGFERISDYLRSRIGIKLPLLWLLRLPLILRATTLANVSEFFRRCHWTLPAAHPLGSVKLPFRKAGFKKLRKKNVKNWFFLQIYILNSLSLRRQHWLKFRRFRRLRATLRENEISSCLISGAAISASSTFSKLDALLML